MRAAFRGGFLLGKNMIPDAFNKSKTLEEAMQIVKEACCEDEDNLNEYLKGFDKWLKSGMIVCPLCEE